MVLGVKIKLKPAKRSYKEEDKREEKDFPQFNMLARDHSLSSKKDIELVKKQGKLVSSESFSFVYLDHKTDSKSRFAFVVSTKISKLSTERNKARRALSEGVRHVVVYLKPGLDIVFLGKPGIERKYMDKLMEEVKVSLEKEGLFK